MIHNIGINISLLIITSVILKFYLMFSNFVTIRRKANDCDREYGRVPCKFRE